MGDSQFGQWAFEMVAGIALLAMGAWAKLQGGRLTRLETKVDQVNKDSEDRSRANRETIASSVTAVHDRLNEVIRSMPDKDDIHALSGQIAALNGRIDAVFARQSGGNGNGSK